jgi:soluble lytic murein transglycosylase-like protein
VRYGCTILKYYLDMENGDLGPALARYNGSRGQRKYPNKVLLPQPRRQRSRIHFPFLKEPGLSYQPQSGKS